MRHPIVLASFISGACIVIAACILSWNLRRLGEDFRASGAFVSGSTQLRFPDTISLNSGNRDLRVLLRNDRVDPLVIQQKPAE